MKMTFIGATHEVTGSCTYLEVCGKRLLVDFGMEQGRDTYENVKIPCAPSQIDYVLLTHAHIDHSGLLPLLYAGGFSGEIHATSATCSLCEIMLRDSAHIQEFEAEWRNRKAMRKGGEPYVPLYTMKEALGALELFVPHPYGERFTLTSGIDVRFLDAGHLLGSSSIEIWLTENGISKKLVFSGDIGNLNQPLIRDPQPPEDADYVVMECTYGDRSHPRSEEHVEELAQIIQETLDRGGNVVLPAFAVGRTQELLFFLRKIKLDHMVTGHSDFQVYVDSPLAVEATHVFKQNLLRCYDEETRELVESGINPIEFPGLKVTVTSDESKAINFDSRPKVIISASGMCDAGRIRHHLKHNLWRPECTIVFAGYQAVGTLGRSLVDGTDQVRLFGETIEVKAQIRMMEGLSGHADQDGLIRWIRAYKEKPKMTFIVHGDDKVCDIFADRLNREEGIPASAPFSGSVYDLAEGSWLKVTKGIPIQPEKESRRRADGIFARLVAAGERLCRVIKRNEGGANKDLAKFTDQIHALCDKWDR